MWVVSPPSGLFQYTKKLFLREQAGRAQAGEFLRRNAANALSMANLVMGLSSVLCSLNGQSHCACWLVLTGFLLDLADGAVARRLDACSALGESPTSPLLGLSHLGCLCSWGACSGLSSLTPAGAKLDDFADFTSFGLATALLLQAQGLPDGLLAIVYVLAVFTRLCFFSSGLPFMYRGLPCPYGAAVLASTCILTGGNRVMMRVVAMVMVLFMVDQGFYPHDKVLESQAWKKLVYTGGVLALLLPALPTAALYYLAWSLSYIFFPTVLWSYKAPALQ
ncbi:hypothetical protein lerEdw1_003124 [Lerista edwardsae]|nr:hypothetical protein lerEdw1_003124 [Lerista edwardsae]